MGVACFERRLGHRPVGVRSVHAGALAPGLALAPSALALTHTPRAPVRVEPCLGASHSWRSTPAQGATSATAHWRATVLR